MASCHPSRGPLARRDRYSRASVDSKTLRDIVIDARTIMVEVAALWGRSTALYEGTSSPKGSRRIRISIATEYFGDAGSGSAIWPRPQLRSRLEMPSSPPRARVFDICQSVRKPYWRRSGVGVAGCNEFDRPFCRRVHFRRPYRRHEIRQRYTTPGSVLLPVLTGASQNAARPRTGSARRRRRTRHRLPLGRVRLPAGIRCRPARSCTSCSRCRWS
jgi:hypothetical protein